MEPITMNKATERRLAGYERRYQDLAEQIVDIGFVSAGSITQRYTRCTNAKCRCRGNPPQMHGPYYQWTAKVEGKTVTKRLSEKEVTLYKKWIANDRKLSALIAKMREVAAKAEVLILEEEVKSQG